MDLNTPLQSLLLRPDPARALTAIANVDYAMTGRQIARVIHVSPTQTARALQLLTHIGLITRKPAGNAYLYAINDEHLLWPAIQAALSTPEQLHQRIRDFVTSSALPRASVILYGSTARGDATDVSDIDLVLICPEDAPADARDALASSLSSAVTRWTGNPAQVYELDVSTLRQKAAATDPIVTSWLRDGVTLVGQSVPEHLEA
ncbi:nucleotidyltransferase domain-containing protein [Pseudoclavibacter soli]|uniref:nucleotidyltransferase domain-containing protein n=1 Tax=Pseudoclavibacter soli TaxID=452623 RepID=UPI000415C944|nr:nucleotidyltransferase domain-containing protein [Pseudoclavibacter soli]